MKRRVRIIFGLCAALLIMGGVVSYGLKAHSGAPMIQGVQTQKSDDQALQADLTTLLGQHTNMSVEALKGYVNAVPDTTSLMNAVDANSVELAEKINTMFGGTKDEFLALWRGHVTYYVDYMAAVQVSDKDARQMAKQHLSMFAAELGSFFVKQHIPVNKGNLQQAFTLHGEQMMRIIDELVAHHPDEVYKQLHDAYNHMCDIASMIATAYTKR